MLDILKWFGESGWRPAWLVVLIIAVGASIQLARSKA